MKKHRGKKRAIGRDEKRAKKYQDLLVEREQELINKEKSYLGAETDFGPGRRLAVIEERLRKLGWDGRERASGYD